MRYIAATTLLLCICISNAQGLFRAPNYRFHDALDSRKKATRSLLKRQSFCGDGPSTCTAECCDTGSGTEQCCPDGSCCPISDSDGLYGPVGTHWRCDLGPLGGCCTPDNDSLVPCSDASPTAAIPSKAPIPSPSHAHKNVTVSATDPRITYSPQWNLGASTCDASQKSKKTVTTNQSLSFNTHGFSVGSGGALYVDFSQKNASFQILMDGQSVLNGVGVGVLKNCTYNGPITLSTAAEIKILVNSEGTTDSDWFFEFNSFLVTENSSAPSATRSTGVRVIGALLLAAVFFV